MVCIKSLANCPEWVEGLAYFGGTIIGLALWAFIGYLTVTVLLAYWGKRRYQDLDKDRRGWYVYAWVFWPIAWVVAVIMWVIGILGLPFTAARRRDLREMEQRINRTLEDRSYSTIPVISQKFKPGDLITGVRGNPDDYNHLDEGCVCRVLSIDDKGRMKVVLANHKNFEEQKDWFGNTFKAPARNFVKYPRSRAKKKSVKRRKKK